MSSMMRGREPPDLQALVVAHGVWSAIPDAAWTEFDHAMFYWQARLRDGQAACDSLLQPTYYDEICPGRDRAEKPNLATQVGFSIRRDGQQGREMTGSWRR
jgi:hypothetical protein